MLKEQSFDVTKEHANAFAQHILDNRNLIQKILRKYQSKEVIDDEIRRSVEMLQNINELQNYFIGKVNKISTFLPLNLPLYSFVLFAATPSYQSQQLVVRPPEKMGVLFSELCQALKLEDFYKNIIFFNGKRQDFVDLHCYSSDVVIFTGKYENFLKIREFCNRKTLFLYNGVGHNPLVITEVADLELAAEKAVYVKLFNNGQDCAGPDTILVHSSVIDEFLVLLVKKIKQIKTGYDYASDSTRVGPLFETTSLDRFNQTVKKVAQSGGEIIEGGVVDFKHNLIYPCICRTHLKTYSNYEELYSPIFIVTEYENDQELDLYFNDEASQYTQKQMYVSVFGYSQYIEKNLPGTIPLLNTTIHDLERGTEEYGGYSSGASAVSMGKLFIPKPILIPREIYTFLLSPYNEIIKSCGHIESAIIGKQFTEITKQIFKENLVFAYIFGSYASNKAKTYSDIDTLICVRKKDPHQIKMYLKWLFEISEIFGKIPDFKYPSEIVEFDELQSAVLNFEKLTLTTEVNTLKTYDSMIWIHSLSHFKSSIVNEENIPQGWEKIFAANLKRILLNYLLNLKEKTNGWENSYNQLYFSNIPTSQDGIDNYIKNLGNGGRLVELLKYVPFQENALYPEEVRELVRLRRFFGAHFLKKDDDFNFDPMFRFAFIGNELEKNS